MHYLVKFKMMVNELNYILYLFINLYIHELLFILFFKYRKKYNLNIFLKNIKLSKIIIIR